MKIKKPIRANQWTKLANNLTVTTTVVKLLSKVLTSPAMLTVFEQNLIHMQGLRQNPESTNKIPNTASRPLSLCPKLPKEPLTSPERRRKRREVKTTEYSLMTWRSGNALELQKIAQYTRL